MSCVIPVYEALALDLRAMGVECLFGLMSDDTALLAAAVDGAGVRFIGTRHENTAAAAAEGYAAASGRLGIALFGRGPATANAMHGVTYAARSGSKVLFLIGDRPVAAGPANGYGPDTKRFDAVAALRAADVPTMVALEPQGARRLLAQAAAATRSGAVALLLPTDVQLAMIDPQATRPAPIEVPVLEPRRARAAAIRSAAHLLSHSRRPLLIAGAGAHLAGARDALIRLGDRLGAALATTMKAKDLFRGHPFDCGVVGSFSHGGGRRLIEQSDCVLAVGAGLNQRTTAQGSALPADVPLIQVDVVRTNIGRWYPADVALVGDAKLVAEQLADVVPERPPAEQPLRTPQLREWLARYDLSTDFVPADTDRTLDARSVALELDRLLPPDRNVVYDAGNFLAAAPYLSVPGPAHIKQASDFSSIGMGFGAALGFAHASPGRTTVLMLGDGSFLMTLGELETAARESIPLIVVLMNDCAYGAELHYLRLRGAPVSLSQFPDIDFAPIAQAFGFRALTIRSLEALRALAPTLAAPDGPVLLDCKLNASVTAPFLTDGLQATQR